jgi:hypothetical protein
MTYKKDSRWLQYVLSRRPIVVQLDCCIDLVYDPRFVGEGKGSSLEAEVHALYSVLACVSLRLVYKPKKLYATNLGMPIDLDLPNLPIVQVKAIARVLFDDVKAHCVSP